MIGIRRYVNLALFITILVLGILGPWPDYLNVDSVVLILEEMQENPLAPLLYVALYSLGVLVAFPGLALIAVAGSLFGFYPGVLYVILGANLGCQISFLLSRYVGKAALEPWIRNHAVADTMVDKVENNSFVVMLYLRLIPVFPVALVNYAAGLTNMKYRDYALATFLGMLPGICIYVHLSVTATDIAANPSGVLFSIGVLGVFTMVTTWIRRVYKFA